MTVDELLRFSKRRFFRGPRVLAGLAALLLAALVAGPAFAQQRPALQGITRTDARASFDEAAPQGVAVAIGGALANDNAEVWSRLVQLSGGRGSRWVVIPAAASDPRASGEAIARLLRRHGARATSLPVSPRLAGHDVTQAVRDPKLIAAVQAARGIYFAGGAQERIVDTLQPGGVRTPLLDAIWRVYRAGGVVAGSSAGAAIMSGTMFRDAQDVLRVMKQPHLVEGREIDRGLGFVGPALFVDQHFLKRGRIGRILPLMLQAGYRLGLGIDENSAAIVRGEQVEVIGAKGALLVDLRDATHDPSLGAFNLRNARLDYLDRGDRHDLATGRTTPAAWKLRGKAIEPGSAGFKPYFERAAFVADMLGDTAIVEAMGRLLDNRDDTLVGLAFAGIAAVDDPRPALGFEFRLRRTAETRGWYSGAQGGEDYTVLGMRLDVTPVEMAQPLYRALQPPAASSSTIREGPP